MTLWIGIGWAICFAVSLTIIVMMNRMDKIPVSKTDFFMSVFFGPALIGLFIHSFIASGIKSRRDRKGILS